MPPDEHLYTAEEVKNREVLAVLHSKMSRIDEIMPSIHDKLKSLDDGVRGLPVEIATCKNRIEADLKKYMHDNFMQTPEVQALFKSLANRITWTLTGIGIGVSTLYWLLNFAIEHTHLLEGVFK